MVTKPQLDFDGGILHEWMLYESKQMCSKFQWHGARLFEALRVSGMEVDFISYFDSMPRCSTIDAEFCEIVDNS